MKRDEGQPGEEFVRLALAIDEHQPGFVDAYFGPDEWMQETKNAGKIPLHDLSERVNSLADDISQASDMDEQRKDFLERQVNAMQMSLRLLGGEKVSLAEEAGALYDIQPQWKDEAIFEEGHRALEEALPAGGSLPERLEAWKKSLEIPLGKVRELLPFVIDRLRELTRTHFDMPVEETFEVEFVTDQPWMAYNWYIGKYRSRIEINTDLPASLTELPEIIAHEAYPGHHTELVMKEQKLIGQKKYVEHAVILLNSPSSVMSEGIATSALETLLTDGELEDWYREELLPRAGLTHIDPKRIPRIRRALQKGSGLWGNAAFMLHEQNKSDDEVCSYLKKYGLHTDQEAERAVRFISNPLDRFYVFTYHAGYELLSELFSHLERHTYFARLLEEPVTPSRVQQWISKKTSSN
jgi:hypothetical protein